MADAGATDVKRLSLVPAVLSWMVSRCVLVLLIARTVELPALTDIVQYHDWSQAAYSHGIVPGRDFPWEYPPGALPFVLIPSNAHGQYGFLIPFAILMILFDAALMLRLFRTGEPAGFLVWVAGPLLLGPLFLERFDIVPAVLAGLALLELRRRPALASALLTLGAAVKLWPAALFGLFLRERDHLGRAVVSSVALSGVLLLAFWVTGVLPAFSSTFAQQHDRGFQVEAVGATPFVLAATITGGKHYFFRHGAWEVQGVGTDLGSQLMGVVLFVLVGGFLIALLRRRHQVDVAVAGAAITALLMVTDKALSPQYLTWLFACVAAAACRPFAHRGRVVGLVLLAAALTHLVYPLGYESLLHGSGIVAVVLTLRNLCLVACTVLLVRAALAAPPTASLSPEMDRAGEPALA